MVITVSGTYPQPIKEECGQQRRIDCLHDKYVCIYINVSTHRECGDTGNTEKKMAAFVQYICVHHTTPHHTTEHA